MALIVPVQRPIIGATDILATQAVRGRHATQLGEALNYIKGHGCTVVPGHVVPARTLLTTSSGEAIFRYWGWRNPYNVDRLWSVLLTGSDGGSVRVRAPATTGTPIDIAVPPSSVGSRLFGLLYVEEKAAKEGSAGELTIGFERIGGGQSGGVHPLTISACDIPRTILDAADGGVDLNAVRSQDPILSESIANLDDLNIQGLVRHNPLAVSANTTPGTAGFFSTTSTSFANVLGNSYPTIARPLVIADGSTRSINHRFYVQAVGDDVQVRVSGVSGAATAIVASGSKAWTSELTYSIPQSDQDEATGALPSGAWPAVDYEARVVNGTGTGYIYAVSSYE